MYENNLIDKEFVVKVFGSKVPGSLSSVPLNSHLSINNEINSDGVFASGSSLSLDYINNISNYVNKEPSKRCPNVHLYADILDQSSNDNSDKYKRVPLRCGRWDCPFCGPMNKLILENEIIYCLEQSVLDLKEKGGFRLDHIAKFLTLTVPGWEYRSKRSIDEAQEDIKKYFNNLITTMKKKYGKKSFEFVWVDSPQEKSGYPHLHVILFGKVIVQKSILGYIRKMWTHKYCMGNVDIRSIDLSGKGIKNTAKYIVQYTSSNIGGNGRYKKNYSFSQGWSALLKERKEAFRRFITVLAVGSLSFAGDGSYSLHEFWNYADRNEIVERVLDRDMREAVFDDLLIEYGFRIKSRVGSQIRIEGVG